MLKLSYIGERLFNSIDNFFQGTTKIDLVEISTNLDNVNSLNYNYIEWNLHQDYVDIAIFDLKASFSWIIPGSIRKLARRIRQLGLIYLYTDIAEEENTEILDYQPIFPVPAMNKVLLYPQVIQDVISSKCLFINDWVKKYFRKCNLIIKFGLLKKPYYLLGNFAPYQYEVPLTETSFIMKEFNSFKLNPAIAYHKRI